MRVDKAYRTALAATLSDASDVLSREIEMFPNHLGVLVFRLRETGIAKSHRPLQLVEEAGLVPAGHGRIDEMLVGAHGGSLQSLRSLILHRDVGGIRANLSAIERIEPWSRVRRAPEGTAALKERGSALLRPFSYVNETAEQALISDLRHFLRRLGLSFRTMRLNKGRVVMRVHNLHNVSDDVFEDLLEHPGIRQIIPEPIYSAAPSSSVPSSRLKASQLPLPAPDLPVVAIFDTGASSSAAQLAPWIVGRDTYVLPPETNHEHGTAVGSLVAYARALNDDHQDLPPAGCLVYDVCALESGDGSYISDLVTRLRDALKKRPDIRVWNLSLGTASPCGEQEFSEFAKVLDELSDTYNVLFVVAAGNYLDVPRRQWPTGSSLEDRISSPAESVRALTVGSVCHASASGTLGAAGEPAPYSRRGPGPVFTPKPDIVHIGGGVHSPWSAGKSSVTVLSPDDNYIKGFGTSYAAPVASSMAAHTWKALEGRYDSHPTPALVKALMIHAAQLASPPYSPAERRYYGTGLPLDVMSSLYDSADSFTLVFEAHLVPGLQRWRKAPYPIPSCLRKDGKFCGEVIITATYAPPLDPDAGAEYVRANVELGFGILDGDHIDSKVPMKGEAGSDGYESAQVEHGGKWSPVKVHRKSFPRGVTGEDWVLQARAFMRALEPALTESLRVYITCTLRALDGNPNVYADGIRALNATNWVHQSLPVQVPIHV